MESVLGTQDIYIFGGKGYEMKISKTFKFEMAHKLFESYTCKCMNLHGHSYKVIVTLEGEVNLESGVVTDFTKLKELSSELFEKLDHNCMVCIQDKPTVQALKALMSNEASKRFIVCSKEPTAENIGLFIFNEIAGLCVSAEGVAKLHSVEVFETETSRAIITANDVATLHVPSMQFYSSN